MTTLQPLCADMCVKEPVLCRLLAPPLAARRGCSGERPHVRMVQCQAQRSDSGPGPQSAKATRECEEAYPSERLDLTPEDGLFPR